MKKIAIRVVALLIVAAAVFWGYRFYKQFQQKQQVIPTAAVRKGDVVIRSFTRGELRAVRSVTLIAPNLFGTVQITRLAPLGSFAREKDLIVEFDDSEVQSRVEEKQLELDQLDEQLKKAQADLEIRNNQDQVDLLRSRYSVRRAELEVKRNELLSAIDAKRNQLNLDEAQRRLKQLQSDIKSRLESSQAELAVLREKKNKAILELNREKARLRQVKLLTPMAGLVAVRQNRGNFMMRGMQLPDLREGDQIFPGLPVADVLDLSELEVAAKVGELDRANLRDGQDVTMRLDAAPDKLFHGTIKTLSGTASANVWSGDMAKKFDVVFSVDMKELLGGLGAKPDQIRRILETAERNRKRPIAGQTSLMARMGDVMGGPGGMPGGFAGGAPMMAQAGGLQGGDQQAGGESGGRVRGAGRVRGEGASAGGEGGRGGMGGNMSQEERQKMRESFQKLLGGRNMQDLSAEERQKLFEQMRGMRGGSAQGQGEGQGRTGTQRGQGGAQGERSPGTPMLGFSGGPGGQGGRSGRGEGGGPARGEGMGFGGFGMGGSQEFSDKELQNANLPAAPEEDNQLEVLLRPGLLADVEIIVEKIPNAIHIPVQAVFDKEGKPVVFVKHGNEFEERVVKPLKRSESTMVIAEGLQPGELLALADPTAAKGEKKSDKGASRKSGMPTPGGPGAGGKQ